MNDLRLLHSSDVLMMPSTDASEGSQPAEDLVDLIVVGALPFALEVWSKEPGTWYATRREAYYARMHGRRRPNKADPFNRVT